MRYGDCRATITQRDRIRCPLEMLRHVSLSCFHLPLSVCALCPRRVHPCVSVFTCTLTKVREMFLHVSRRATHTRKLKVKKERCKMCDGTCIQERRSSSLLSAFEHSKPRTTHKTLQREKEALKTCHALELEQHTYAHKTSDTTICS